MSSLMIALDWTLGTRKKKSFAGHGQNDVHLFGIRVDNRKNFLAVCFYYLNSNSNALLYGAIWKHGLNLRDNGGTDETSFHANRLCLLSNSCHQSKVHWKVIGDDASHTALIQILCTLQV